MWPLTKKGLFETGRVLFLPVDAIQPNPYQPRRTFTQPELEELADSIRELGVLQPLTVRRREDRKSTRLNSSHGYRLAGLESVPCLSIQTDSQSSSLLALVENLQRRDLDFWEEATAKTSSVLRKAISSRSKRPMAGSSFWLRERDIRAYRRLMTSWVRACSARDAPAAIRERPANCPAEVTLLMEMRAAPHTGTPAAAAEMPKAKETEKYPRPMGVPSPSPFWKLF